MHAKRKYKWLPWDITVTAKLEEDILLQKSTAGPDEPTSDSGIWWRCMTHALVQRPERQIRATAFGVHETLEARAQGFVVAKIIHLRIGRTYRDHFQTMWQE